MTSVFNTMSLDELRQYVLNHRENIDAFEIYVDRSHAAGRMIVIDPSDAQWEENLAQAKFIVHRMKLSQISR